MFCYQCGTEIPDNSAFCFSCGAKIPTGTETSANDKITLTIDRASQVYLINPPIKVVINGDIRLSLENGKTEKVQLEPGAYTVELSGSFRSKTVNLDLQKDTVLAVSFSRITGQIKAEILK